MFTSTPCPHFPFCGPPLGPCSAVKFKPGTISIPLPHPLLCPSPVPTKSIHSTPNPPTTVHPSSHTSSSDSFGTHPVSPTFQTSASHVTLSTSTPHITISAPTTHIIPPTPTTTSSVITTTPSAPASTPTPSLTFKPFTLTTCLSGTINWVYAGEPHSVNLTLTVDNNIPQDPPPPLESSTSILVSRFSNTILRRQATAQPLVNKTLSTQIDPASESYLWPFVNEPQGWYQIHAISPSYSETTQPLKFYIREGTNTSCLAQPKPSTASTPSRTSAIAGGTIGGVIAVMGLCMFYFCIYRKRKKTSSFTSIINEAASPLESAPPSPSIRISVEQIQPIRRQVETPNDPEAQDTLPSLRTPNTRLLPDHTFASTYSMTSASLRSIESYPDVLTAGHPSREHVPSYAEGHSSLHSASWSYVALPQPRDTRASVAGSGPLYTGEMESRGTSFSFPSTFLPVYEPPLSPPSFRSVESAGNARQSVSTLSLSRAGLDGLSYLLSLSPYF